MSFRVSIFKDIFWIPLSDIGTERLTSVQLNDISQMERPAVSSLREAVDLFQYMGFNLTKDISYIDLKWEVHKTAYDAWKTCEGECVSCASWLRYVLDDVYEEVGYYALCGSNGLGHVMNYIKYNDKFYFFDLYLYWQNKFKILESGNKGDLLRIKYITSLFLCSDSLESMALFLKKRYRFYESSLLILSSNSLNFQPISLQNEEDKLTVTISRNSFEVVLCDEAIEVIIAERFSQ